MAKQHWYLAIDQGGGSTRAIVFDRAANIIAKAQQAVSVEHPRLGWVEQDAEELASSVDQVIEQICKQLNSDVERLCAAGLATQRSNIVCWDRRSGKALSPAISWQDRRAFQWVAQFQPHSQMIRDKTGLLVTAHYGVSKLKWCLDNLAQVREAQQQDYLAYGPLASFLVYRLLEQPANLVDPANASRTLLWNIDTKDWDAELLSLFDIPGKYLPQCVTTSASYGVIKMRSHLVPLSVVTGDQSAALYAFGLPDDETVYINMGTGVFIQRPTGQCKIDIPRLLCSVVYQDKKHSHYVIECTVNGASNALMEVEEALGISGTEAEQQFGDWLQRYADPPLFLNGVAGLGAPYWIPDFPCKFIGDGTAEEKIVAVAESILFLTFVNLQILQEQYAPLKKLVVTGGLSNSDALCQKLANLVQLPVYRPRQCEATAMGVAYLTAGMPVTWEVQQDGAWFQVESESGLLSRFNRWNEAMQTELKRHNSK
ncbi:FGGY family carbohydrate kinase [Kaarinaea lacus]